MLFFLRTYIDQVLIHELEQCVHDCWLYEVRKGEDRCGRFFSGTNFSFFELADAKYRIKYGPEGGKNPSARVVHQYRGEEVALVEGRQLRLPEGRVFRFREDNSLQGPGRGSTANEHAFFLEDGHETFYYAGKIIAPFACTGDPKQHLYAGCIRPPGEHPLFLSMLGLHFIEAYFRQQPVAFQVISM
ncbi:MAG TPA: hypothetical protein VHK69_12060 [Chitinophagaceae bacterium]|jgi:hypothetical protein|nr:hypothetical protein [Chitinophagaceae bacterium]